MPLRVIQAFGDHSVGEQITDPAAVTAILEFDQAGFVVSVAEPAPEKPAKASATNSTSAS